MNLVERLRFPWCARTNTGAGVEISSDQWRAIMDEAAAEIKQLQQLKTPASRQLLNITKAALEHAEEECERLTAALRRIAGGGEKYDSAAHLMTIAADALNATHGR